MSPGVATGDLLTVIATQTVGLWLLGWIIWQLEALLDRGCPECPHCIDRNCRREAEARAAREAYEGQFRDPPVVAPPEGPRPREEPDDRPSPGDS